MIITKKEKMKKKREEGYNLIFYYTKMKYISNVFEHNSAASAVKIQSDL